MPIDNEGLYYTKIEDFIKWISENFAGILANDSANEYTVTSDNSRSTIKESLLHGEGRVDGFLKKRGFVIPIPTDFIRSHNVIRMFVYNIAVFELYGRRGITKERYYKYTKTIQDLKELSSGIQDLPDCDVPSRFSQKISHGNALPSTFAESKRSHANSL
jgi:hypothetical protein